MLDSHACYILFKLRVSHLAHYLALLKASKLFHFIFHINTFSSDMKIHSHATYF